MLVDAWKLGCWLSCGKRHIPCLPSDDEQTDGTELVHHLPSRVRSHGNAVSGESTAVNTEQKRRYRRVHFDLQQSNYDINKLRSLGNVRFERI